MISKNGSETEPARLLVFLLSQEGEAIKTPMKAAGVGKLDVWLHTGTARTTGSIGESTGFISYSNSMAWLGNSRR